MEMLFVVNKINAKRTMDERFQKHCVVIWLLSSCQC